MIKRICVLMLVIVNCAVSNASETATKQKNKTLLLQSSITYPNGEYYCLNYNPAKQALCSLLFNRDSEVRIRNSFPLKEMLSSNFNESIDSLTILGAVLWGQPILNVIKVTTAQKTIILFLKIHPAFYGIGETGASANALGFNNCSFSGIKLKLTPESEIQANMTFHKSKNCIVKTRYKLKNDVYQHLIGELFEKKRK